jgi:PBP1b-binding outer membrane lipoprotein LpoB
MKAQIIVVISALFLISCSSRRDTASVQEDAKQEKESIRAQMIDSGTSRVR